MALIVDGRPLPPQTLEESPPQFPHLDSRGLCPSPTDIIMEPQLGSPIQSYPPSPPLSSCSSNHTPPSAPPSTALDPGWPSSPHRPPDGLLRPSPSQRLPAACSGEEGGG
ncbi:unnamed protein product [Pipistrellus nathusii]|uniref:Uncharacterized protein n=1 Tax=Pipistrellus nathusii TaxID=59473 RepID=A0ABN9Z9T9_PIPNA